eukprot:TRINITY_DN24049_c0_g1_i1.p1 TRINITY_DN24049_c0_g1~~TRINITY_DN24049_c0_g1_i1.p1  ORF type:complete len:297 (+),score=14.66 TRINITY_DN24049_c0_g1_i1:184-1074(+)
MDNDIDRAWEALPAPALVCIFSKTSLVDRLRNASLVCRAWRQASEDPRCWESMMVSDTASLEDAFIKADNPYDTFVNPFGRQSDPSTGFRRLQTLIERSRGRLTTLYLRPFRSHAPYHGGPTEDALLRLIADSCPNLKHLSLVGSYCASEEAMCEVVRSCKRLELLDFSDSPCFSATVLEELGSYCPHLRGVRRVGAIDYSQASAITASLPGLRLLNLSGSTLCDAGLSAIVYGCIGLQYLDVTGCRELTFDLYTIRRASEQISDFLYNREVGYEDDPEERYYVGDDYADWNYWPY